MQYLKCWRRKGQGHRLTDEFAIAFYVNTFVGDRIQSPNDCCRRLNDFITIVCEPGFSNWCDADADADANSSKIICRPPPYGVVVVDIRTNGHNCYGRIDFCVPQIQDGTIAKTVLTYLFSAPDGIDFHP